MKQLRDGRGLGKHKLRKCRVRKIDMSVAHLTDF